MASRRGLLTGTLLVLGLCAALAIGAAIVPFFSSGWSEVVVPLSPHGHYALVIGITRGLCPASVYQTYGASGCEPFYRSSCSRICPYIVYRTPRGEREL